MVIPTHAARIHNGMTHRAVASALRQTLPPAEVHVVTDHHRLGAWVPRDQGVQAVRAPWVAFLDSDDVWMMHHLEVLADAAHTQHADYVFSYYMVRDRDGIDRPDVDPLGHFGRPFDPNDPHQTTIVTLVRTEVAQQVGFHPPPLDNTIDGQRYGEDFAFTLGCVKAGAKIVHVPQRTWWWYHHGANTCGLPSQGDAAQ